MCGSCTAVCGGRSLILSKINIGRYSRVIPMVKDAKNQRTTLKVELTLINKAVSTLWAKEMPDKANIIPKGLLINCGPSWESEGYKQYKRIIPLKKIFAFWSPKF